MSEDRGLMDLIDLVSEHHLSLRKYLENRWNENHSVYLSNSEWFIISRIYQAGVTTISQVTKKVDISRQATHKFIRKLKEKGIVEINGLENNKKEKSIRLTDFGKTCYETNKALKEELESVIASNIGAEKVQQLKEILRLDWGLND